MRKNIILLLAISFVLSNCGKADIFPTDKYLVRSEMTDIAKILVHSKKEKNPKILEKEWITYVDDVEKFFISYPADYPKNNPIFMNDMSINRIDGSSCTPTIMGTNTIQNYAHETGGNTVFGIVTGKGYPYEMHTFDDSLCMPPYHPNDEGNYENNHVYDGVGAYVLCSQKEEKTVLICISQMTDNPKLAEEIFSTFRWLP